MTYADQATLTGDMARVAADLLDELALVGAVPSSVTLYRDRVSLSYLDAATRRTAALALGLTESSQAAGIVTQSGVSGDHGEFDVEVHSRLDAEDLRREREDAETAARAKAAAVKAGA